MKTRSVLCLAILFLLAACATPTPEIVLFQSPPQTTTLGAKAIVSGQVAPGARVSVNAQDVPINGGMYATTIDLAWGSNPVIVAVELNGQQQTHTLFVERYAADVDQVGEVYLRLVSTERAQVLGTSPLDETPSGVFLIVTLDVENRSDAPIKMPMPNGFKLEDNAGRLYAMSEKGAFARNWDTQPGYLPSRDLAPGQAIQGWLAFDVAIASKEFVLHARSNPEMTEWYARVAIVEE